MTGWAASSQLSYSGAIAGDELRDIAVKSLAHVLNVPLSVVKEELSSWHEHDWQRDPFSRGAYSYPAAGGAHAAALLAEPVSETIFFAGEATASHGYNATMEGAVRSGIRAAAQVVKSLY